MNSLTRGWLRYCVAGLMALPSVSTFGQTQTLVVFQSGFEPGEGYSAGAMAGQQGWTTFLGESPQFGEIVISGALIRGSQSVLLDARRISLGTLGNYAGVFLPITIPTTHRGLPLRSIEMTGWCAIVDPTLTDPDHFSAGNMSLWHDDSDFVTNLGPNSEYGQLTFGWELPNALPVQNGVPFQFRHKADYQTGLATQWMNGQLVYHGFPDAFDPNYVPNQLFFEMFAFDLLPFDTQVWYDDVMITATYVPEPSSLLALGLGAAMFSRLRKRAKKNSVLNPNAQWRKKMNLSIRFKILAWGWLLLMSMSVSASAQPSLQTVWWTWIQRDCWGPIFSIDFSPDGNLIAVAVWSGGQSRGAITIQRVRDGSHVRTWTAHDYVSGVDGATRSVAFSPDGTLLASGGVDRTVKLWRVSDGSLVRTMTGHTDFVNVVVFSPDGQTLLSGSGDQTVRFWRVSDGSLLRQLNAGTHVGAVAVSPDGEQVATGGGAGDNYYHNHLLARNPTLGGSTISVWRFSDGQLLRTLQVNRACFANTVHAIRYSRDGRYLGATNYHHRFCGAGDAALRIFSASDGSEMYDFWLSSVVTCFDFAPDSRAFAITDNIDTTRLKAFPNHFIEWRAPIITGYTSRMSVRFSPNGRYLAATYGRATGTQLALYRNPLWTPGDVNGDGCVDDGDLLSVLFAFGTDHGLSDLSENGIVDDADLLEVLFNFGC